MSYDKCLGNIDIEEKGREDGEALENMVQYISFSHKVLVQIKMEKICKGSPGSD